MAEFVTEFKEKPSLLTLLALKIFKKKTGLSYNKLIYSKDDLEMIIKENNHHELTKDNYEPLFKSNFQTKPYNEYADVGENIFGC